MDSEAGGDLSWFWNGWYLSNWKYDASVDKIEGNVVTIGNYGQLVLPTPVEITLGDGSKPRMKLAAEMWESKGTMVVNVEALSPVADC